MPPDAASRWRRSPPKSRPPIPRVTVDTFQHDPMFPRVATVVASILKDSKVVTPVAAMVGMGWLSTDDLHAWEAGKVPYLERVTRCNLTTLARFLRILGFHCYDLKLIATPTVYSGNARASRGPLRFTKTGEVKLEKVYARHFVWPGKGPFHMPYPKPERPLEARTSLE
jgi:hypothetical protein